MKKHYIYILFVLAATVGLLLWAFLGPEPIREGQCRLVRHKAGPQNMLASIGYQFVRPLDSKPDIVKDGPTGFERPRYYTVKSGGRSILMAADYSRKNVRLCIDRDGDGSLSEEPCWTARISKDTPVSGRGQQFGPISLASGSGDAEVYINCWRDDQHGLLVPQSRFFRRGTLLLDGQPYQVAIADGDFDGLFNSTVALPWEGQQFHFACDTFAIDLDHNGRFENWTDRPSEIMPLSQMVRIENAYYAIDIALDGKSLRLPKVQPKLGMLSIEANGADVELGLCSDTAHQYLKGHQWKLPAGSYQTIHLLLTKTDGSGDVWLSTSLFPFVSADSQSLSSFTIKPGQTTSLKIGPPFVVKAEVQKTNDDEFLIRPFVVGCAGETYSANIVHNRRCPDRKLKIIAEDGTVLVNDKFTHT